LADPILAMRSATRMTLVRYSLVNSVLTPTPIALPMNPSSVTLMPGLSNEDLRQTNIYGEDQIVLTFLKESVPELNLEFGAATPEIEAAMINRVAVTEAGTTSFVMFEAVANSEAVLGRTAGEHGFEVALQTADDSQALVYYIDPVSKLHKRITIVDATPTGDQMIIGANLTLTLSPELAATGYNIYGWVPGVTFTNTTQIGSISPLLYGAFIEGVCFDGTVRQCTCGRLSWMPGGDFSKEPTRSLKFRVLPDGADKTGLGYSITYFTGTVPAKK